MDFYLWRSRMCRRRRWLNGRAASAGCDAYGRAPELAGQLIANLEHLPALESDVMTLYPGTFRACPVLDIGRLPMVHPPLNLPQ